MIFFLSFSVSAVWAQQKPLPDFFVHRGSQNSVSISWVNNFGDECIQLNVQRSSDSLTNFKTVFSTPAPELPTNGFTDRSVPAGRVFYRIFYMLNGGAYYFTTARQPEGAVAIATDGSNIASTGMVNPNPVAVGGAMVSKNVSGNMVVHLQTPDVYNYRMEIYTLDGSRVLFSIKKFDDEQLILDRGSFLKKGRYRYRIFYGEKEKETGYLDINQ